MALVYVSQDLMIKLFGETELIQLTDRTGSGSLDVAILTQAMETAEAEANSYIGSVYDLPLPGTPPSLPGFVADIARYHLFDAQPTEHVQNKYDRAVSWLKDVAKGIVSLGYAKTDTKPDGTGTIAVSARTQRFTDATFGKMVQPWHTS